MRPPTSWSGHTRHTTVAYTLRHAFALCLCLTLAAPDSGATTVRLLTMEELVAASARIFMGKCLDVRTGRDANGLPVSHVTFEVQDTLKGPATKLVTFRQISGDQPGFQAFGLPTYQPGEEVLLFLHGESRLGLTSPVGLHQGKWSVQYSAGRRFLRRSLPAPLTRGGPEGRSYGTNLGKELHDYQGFVSEIRDLVDQ